MKDRILVDMDGVLADFVGGVNKGLWKRGVRPINWEEMTNYHFEVYSEEEQKIIHEIYSASGFFESLEPIEGGIEGIREIESRGYAVAICTAPARTSLRCEEEKREWAAHHIGPEWAREEKTIVQSDKTAVYGALILDDKSEILGECKPSWKHTIYDQPWNIWSDKPRFKWGDGVDKLLERL